MEYIKFIALLTCVWLFVKGAGSIQFLKNYIGIGAYSKPKNALIILAKELTNCSLCSGFWMGLIYYQDFLMACLVSVCAEIVSRLIDKTLIKWLI